MIRNLLQNIDRGVAMSASPDLLVIEPVESDRCSRSIGLSLSLQRTGGHFARKCVGCELSGGGPLASTAKSVQRQDRSKGNAGAKAILVRTHSQARWKVCPKGKARRGPCLEGPPGLAGSYRTLICDAVAIGLLSADFGNFGLMRLDGWPD